MKVPSRIRITAKVSYEVVWIDQFEDPALEAECRVRYRQIVLKRGQSGRTLFKTLIHEILHAVEYERGIEIPHRVVYQLEGAIESLLRLNGWFEA
jgi:hypothetical protein